MPHDFESLDLGDRALRYILGRSETVALERRSNAYSRPSAAGRERRLSGRLTSKPPRQSARLRGSAPDGRSAICEVPIDVLVGVEVFLMGSYELNAFGQFRVDSRHAIGITLLAGLQ
jgi:hypothetical protein